MTAPEERSNPDLTDFDRYCEEHDIQDDELPAAFGAFLHEKTGWDGTIERLA